MKGVWDYLEKTDPLLQRLCANPIFEEIRPLADWTDLLEALEDSPEPKVTDVPHLVINALRGSRGVMYRVFLDRKNNFMSVYVVFGYGMKGGGELGEGVHPGALASVLHEAVRLLAQNYFPPEVQYKLSSLTFDFLQHLATNTSYEIFIIPDPSTRHTMAQDHVAAIREQENEREKLSVYVKQDEYQGPEEKPPVKGEKWIRTDNPPLDAGIWATAVNTFDIGIFTIHHSPVHALSVIALAEAKFETSRSESWPPPLPIQQKAVELTPEGILK